MAQITRVSPQEMLITAHRIEETILRWEQTVHEIYMLQSELDYMWDGNANNTFNRQWETDKAKYNRLALMMQEYKSAIEAAVKLYQQKENEVVQIMNSGNGDGNAGIYEIAPGYVDPSMFHLIGPDGMKTEFFNINNLLSEDDIQVISGINDN